MKGMYTCGSQDVVLVDLRSDPRSSFSSRAEIERLCMGNLLANPEERVFFKDRESRFLLVSAGWLAALAQGRSLEEVIGKTDFDIFSRPHALAAFEDEQRVIDTGEPMAAKVERETFHDRPDVWVSSTKLPLRDEHGNIIGTWGISRDITAQVEAEQELTASREQLRSSERQHRLLFERNPQPVWVYDRNTFRIVAASNAAIASYGYSREELLSMTAKDLRPPEDVAAYLAYLETAAGQERLGLTAARPWRHRYKDGTIVDVEVTSDDLILDGVECRMALCQNVTQRNRAAAELVAARDEAVEASNLKSAFLANMSHEIRTPMNGVIGMNELLLDTELSDEQRAYAEQVARSGEQMMAIISDVLDVAKIEAGQLELDVTDFDLHETTEQVCAAAGLQLDAKGIQLDVHIDADTPRYVRGDSRRLRQVLMNLLANAVKFTAEGKVAVHVSTRPRPGDDAVIRVEVTDTGIGIDPAALDRMFEPFMQADASTTRNYGGTGLGLAIARELIDLMGGTIGCESKPGRGSTFWFEVELAASVATNGRPPRPGDVGVAAHPLWLTAPLVLVAEDSPVNQIVAVRVLERCGCRVDVVGDGRQALETLSTRRYDAVLMDCQMPDMDGYEATAELRRRENGDHHTPVIAVTAHSMDGDREKCLEAGMDDYISKPMRREQLIDTLQRWIPPQADTAVADDPRPNRS
jgi:two-component system sensor histidine kinase/response regulator